MVAYGSSARHFTQSSFSNSSPWTSKFPYSSMGWQITYSAEGFLTLSSVAEAYTGYEGSPGNGVALFRAAGNFVIPDNYKFILNTTAAEWKGVEGAPWFVQLQISTYSGSNTVFKLCLPQYLPDVRRLACTLHNKDSGAYRGSQAIDDSRNIGPIEYVPLNR